MLALSACQSNGAACPTWIWRVLSQRTAHAGLLDLLLGPGFDAPISRRTRANLSLQNVGVADLDDLDALLDIDVADTLAEDDDEEYQK